MWGLWWLREPGADFQGQECAPPPEVHPDILSMAATPPLDAPHSSFHRTIHLAPSSSKARIPQPREGRWGTGRSNSQARCRSPAPWSLLPCCWFCPQGHGELQPWGTQGAVSGPSRSLGRHRDLFRGPGAAPGPPQPLEDTGCHSHARPRRAQGYVSGLGEDGSLPTSGGILYPARAQAPESGEEAGHLGCPGLPPGQTGLAWLASAWCLGLALSSGPTRSHPPALVNRIL